MNIFYLDKDPKICSEYHNDKHIVKMPVEYVQMLCTAHRLLDGYLTFEISPKGRKIKRWILQDSYYNNNLYKATHPNHPCTLWVRSNDLHYMFLFNLATECFKEYTKRYNKIHKSEAVLQYLKYLPDNIIRDKEFQDPPQCMPEDCKFAGSTVEAYRNLYRITKRSICTWKTQAPKWF